MDARLCGSLIRVGRVKGWRKLGVTDVSVFFFFFLVSAGGKETLSFDIIPCCQITSATGMGDCHLMMPYKCHCKKKRF